MASTSIIFSNPSPLPISVATTQLIPSLSKSFKSLISLLLLFSLPYGRFTEQKYKMTPFYYTKSLQRCPNGLRVKPKPLCMMGTVRPHKPPLGSSNIKLSSLLPQDSARPLSLSGTLPPFHTSLLKDSKHVLPLSLHVPSSERPFPPGKP